ncbi:tetratricopeptide repeat protein [Bradyrhizobium sp. 26S5]|uniref:tetratricopeptide repeat protein n=1 Tax=Bradyrhizobium sp. 26S5 TaxID=3139729 RepID=UPI0030CF0CCF
MTSAGGFVRARRAAASVGIVLALGATFAGAIDTAAAQDSPAKRAPAQSAGSAQAITAQMNNAIALTRGGKIDTGYAQLNAALDAADRLDDAQFVMRQYYQATATLRAVKRDDLAEKLFARALQGKAAAQSPPGNADVLLSYAILISDHARIAEAVPLYMKAIAAYNAYWGEGSEESLIANDKLAVALSANGSAASATNLGRHNFELSEKALGPDHRTTWKLANNYADMLREIGAPAKALELDLFAIEKRAKHYGENHLNTLVTVNNAGQDFLNLGRFDDARRYFRRHRAIATVLAPKDPTFAGQADAWLFYTDMLAGRCRDGPDRSGAAGGDRCQRGEFRGFPAHQGSWAGRRQTRAARRARQRHAAARDRACDLDAGLHRAASGQLRDQARHRDRADRC